jgi:hypothetical protein
MKIIKRKKCDDCGMKFISDIKKEQKDSFAKIYKNMLLFSKEHTLSVQRAWLQVQT